jgi:phosphoglycerate kinase
LDIGPKTIDLFCNIINEAKTIVWNGPMGLIEQKPFDKATKELIDCIAESTYSIVGGGDTVAFIRKIKKEKAFNWLSTGGGAMLDYLANGTLPGIEALKE